MAQGARGSTVSVFRLTDVATAERETKEYWDERTQRGWGMNQYHGLFGDYPDDRVAKMDERNVQVIESIVNSTWRRDERTNVLECACGYGRYLPLVAQMCAGVEYVGIDLAKKNIQEALRLHLGTPGWTFKFEVADMATFQTDERFDLIFMVAAWSSIEQKSAEVIAHLKTLLKPGGKIAVLEENLYMVIDK